MVRKVKIMLAIVALFCALGTTAHAASYTVYEGNPSNTYIQYFKDIIAGTSINEDYVAFRAGQYQYILVVGDLEYDGTTISLAGDGTIYSISNDGSYNGYYSYNVSSITSFSVAPSDKIIYSNVGTFPQLTDRGANYEVISAVLFGVLLLGIVLDRFFHSR